MIFSSRWVSSVFSLVGWPSSFLVASISFQLGDNFPDVSAIPLPCLLVNLVEAYVNLSAGWVLKHTHTMVEVVTFLLEMKL